MIEVSYTLTPDRGYFDEAERRLWAVDIYLTAIHSIEFQDDGSVVILYAVDGDIELLRTLAEFEIPRVHHASVSREDGKPHLLLHFQPDCDLDQLFSAHRSAAITYDLPVQYVSHDPATIAVNKVGPSDRIQAYLDSVRDIATVEISSIKPYDGDTGGLYDELTERQQEVLTTALEHGYYDDPRRATQADLASKLSCGERTVGQHLRRIERHLLTAVTQDRPQPESAQ